MRIAYCFRRASIDGRAALAFTLLAVATPRVDAQNVTRRPQSHPDSVRLAADLFFRAVADERWEVAASMMDTIVVKHIVNQRLRWRGTAQPAQRTLTIDDFMRDDPNKPRAVAEYELKRYHDQSAKLDFDFVSHEFAGVRTLLELSRLSALQATASFLQAQDYRVALRDAARRSGCGDIGGGPPTLHRIIGVALTADTVAFVLHEDGFPVSEEERPMPRRDPMVMQLRLRGGSWQILPSMTLLQRQGSGISFVRCDSAQRRVPE